MDGGELGRQVRANCSGHDTTTGQWFDTRMLITGNNGRITYVIRSCTGEGPPRILSTDDPTIIAFIEELFAAARHVSTPAD